MLTDLQTTKLTRYFRLYDVDDDGRIARPDFERVLENVRALHGADPDSQTHRGLREGFLSRWHALAASADIDEDGGVDLSEWLAYWDAVLADEGRYAAEVTSVAEHLFEIFDTDEDGVLGSDEFVNFYAVYGLKSALARQIFLDLDVDGDGRVTRQELVDMAHDFYRSDDPDAPGNRLFGPLA
ncbi:MAG: EF-hand domain-containing protein [Gemmatimonadota bacterium]|jgi:juvenile hormone diol kinase